MFLANRNFANVASRFVATADADCGYRDVGLLNFGIHKLNRNVFLGWSKPIADAECELWVLYKIYSPSRGLRSHQWGEGKVREDWLNSAAQLYATSDDLRPGLYILVSTHYAELKRGVWTGRLEVGHFMFSWDSLGRMQVTVFFGGTNQEVSKITR